ncbi:hypothetical protein J4465_00475 [Candidatus Pacearchaeota archaeon]|nr:hypothetical protein [Candidatus Pacearchaeota archaeon]
MKLNKKELEILENISEGNSDTHQLKIFTNFDLNKILEIIIKLEKLKLIDLVKKQDKSYNEEYWDAKITSSGKEELRKLFKDSR